MSIAMNLTTGTYFAALAATYSKEDAYFLTMGAVMMAVLAFYLAVDCFKDWILENFG